MKDGWTYVDVRSIPEFDAGHPQGAYNVPLMHATSRGLVANPDFLSVMSARFAKDQPIILGCRAGGRSYQAAVALMREGFTRVVDMRGGFAGEFTRQGVEVCAGWQPRRLPVAATAEPGRSYRELTSSDRDSEQTDRDSE